VIERITADKGKVLYARNDQQLGRIIEARSVEMMNTMMQETLTTGTAHKATLPGWPAAGKTGTSQEFRDAWFIGYTSKLVTGVWLGNDDGTPTKKVTGGSLPTEVWSRVMRDAHQRVPVAGLPVGNRSIFSGLFGGNAPAQDRSTVAQGPIPPAPIGARASSPGTRDSASLDTWLLGKLFGR
jgi:penicillin-binding protein 1A